MLSVIMVVPVLNSGTPVSERILAFKKDFLDRGFDVCFLEVVSDWTGFFKAFSYFLRKKPSMIFITMPPFNKFSFLFSFFFPVVFDWRDGWSIAMRSGYGGLVKPDKVKGLISRMIEFFSLMLSRSVITCTDGLYDYHVKCFFGFFKKKVFLIENGHSLALTSSLFCNINLENKNLINAVCAGKFSEYGVDKCKAIIDELSFRYSKSKVLLKIIGADFEVNNWVVGYSRDRGVSVTLIERKPYEEVVSLVTEADIAIAVIRDPSYDYGTKVFDYISCGVPILDVYSGTVFRNKFSGCFDTDYKPVAAYHKACEFRRSEKSSQGFDVLFKNLGIVR